MTKLLEGGVFIAQAKARRCVLVPGAVFERGYPGARHDRGAVSSEGDLGAVCEHENLWVRTKAFGSLPGRGRTLVLLFRRGRCVRSLTSSANFCLSLSE